MAHERCTFAKAIEKEQAIGSAGGKQIEHEVCRGATPRQIIVQEAKEAFIAQVNRRRKGNQQAVEIEARQGPAVAALASMAFPDARVLVLRDLAGMDRVVSVDRRTMKEE